jgi:epsin
MGHTTSLWNLAIVDGYADAILSQLLSEIMPMIYKRFTEKAAEEWRQIYKVGVRHASVGFGLTLSQGLQLLEFLIKNGSERVIDDARSHLSLLKMLRQFHYLDPNGKDQGLNVRNRAKELADLLSDVDKIRAERKKARSNRNKFGGVEGGAGLGGSSSMSGMSGGSSSRYGGFGSEDASYGGYTGGTYGDGGGFGGNASSNFQDSGRRDKFEEYDEGDDVAASSTTKPRKSTSHASATRRKVEEPPKAKEPEVDLFEFGDDDIPPVIPPKTPSNGKQAVGTGYDVDDDDFDDFISAPQQAQPAAPAAHSAIPGLMKPPSVASATQYAAPQPVSAAKGSNLNNLVGFGSISPVPQPTTPSNTFSVPPSSTQAYKAPTAAAPPHPTGFQAAQPNYFTSIPAASSTSSLPLARPGAQPTLSPSSSFTGSKPVAKSTASSSGGDAFGSLWSTASASAGIKKTTPGTQSPNLASLAKEKASAGIWGAASQASASASASAGSTPRPQQTGGKTASAWDDLLG